MKKILEILKNSSEPQYDILKLYEDGSLEILCPILFNLSHTEDGHKNNFFHTLQVLKNACDMGFDYNMRIIAVFHDIAKPKTKRKKGNKDWSFHGHEDLGAKMFLKLLKDNNINDMDTDYLYRMIKYHGRIKMQRDVSESAIRRLDKDVGADIIFDVIEFSKCDITTKFQDKKDRITSGLNKIKDRIIEVREKDEYDAWRSPLTGHVIMELLPDITGREIGDIKKEYETDLRSEKITLEDAIKDIKRNFNIKSDLFIKVTNYFESIKNGDAINIEKFKTLILSCSYKDTCEILLDIIDFDYNDNNNNIDIDNIMHDKRFNKFYDIISNRLLKLNQ